MWGLSFTRSEKFGRLLFTACAVTLFCLSLVLFFYKLDKAPLEQWDEQTNYEVVRDTYAQENKLFLTKDQRPFFEKPPLWYYTTMVSISLFGENNFSMRLVSAVSGLSITAIIYYFVKRNTNKNAGLIAAASFLSVGQNFISFPAGGYFSTHTYRSADLDALQIALLLSGFVLSLRFNKNSKKRLVLVGFLFGLAFLAKGPLALILLLVILGLSHFKKQLSAKRTLVCLASFVLTILPWHLLMTIEYGDAFTRSYFEYHLLQRSVTSLEGHSGGIFFYPEVLIQKYYFVLWPLLLLIVFNFRVFLKTKPGVRVLAIMILILVLLTLVGTKLAWYILPFYPFFCISLGILANNFQKQKGSKIPLSLIFLFIVLGLVINVSYVLSL